MLLAIAYSLVKGVQAPRAVTESSAFKWLRGRGRCAQSRLKLGLYSPTLHVLEPNFRTGADKRVQYGICINAPLASNAIARCVSV